jgi:hypothetical protein
MRRRALHWLLAAALVFAQLGVHAHGLSHLGKALYGQDGAAQQTSHDPATCLAFETAAGGAVTAAALPLGGEAPHTVAGLAPTDPLLPSLALARFASRAPPVLS